MNYILMLVKSIFVIAAIFVFSNTGICQAKKNDLKTDEIPAAKGRIKKCPPNPETLYDRQQMLDKLVEILNISIPEYNKDTTFRFYSENGANGGFFIYYLTDPSNKEIFSKDCVNFVNNHVYHVAPIYFPYSFSHIIILEDGKLKVFRSINCKDRGDSLDDVVIYLNQKLKKDKDEIIERVKNYRQYGKYAAIDSFIIRCGDYTDYSNIYSDY